MTYEEYLNVKPGDKLYYITRYNKVKRFTVDCTNETISKHDKRHFKEKLPFYIPSEPLMFSYNSKKYKPYHIYETFRTEKEACLAVLNILQNKSDYLWNMYTACRKEYSVMFERFNSI